jgi:hypothetical protein
MAWRTSFAAACAQFHHIPSFILRHKWVRMTPMTSTAVSIPKQNDLSAIDERTARCKIKLSYCQRGEDEIPEVSAHF